MNEKYRWLTPLFKVLLFGAIWIGGGSLLLRYAVWPGINALPEEWQLELEPYLVLDYGRVVERVFRFFWTLLLFLMAEKWMNNTPYQDTVLFKTPYKIWTLLRGAFSGAFLAAALISLCVFSGTIKYFGIHINVWTFLSTLVLYGICLSLTAMSIELALRGFVLNTLLNAWGTHRAVWITSILLGLVDLTVSPYHAYTTFVMSILLGYAFAWNGIYYCIGWHFAWDFLETIFYSGKAVHFHVIDSFLAGQKAISPDQQGFLALPILLVGFAWLLATHKTEWRLSENKEEAKG